MPAIVLSAEDVSEQYKIPTLETYTLKELDSECVVVAIVQLLSRVYCFVTP